jgi:hypothetical protein
MMSLDEKLPRLAAELDAQLEEPARLEHALMASGRGLRYGR